MTCAENVIIQDGGAHEIRIETRKTELNCELYQFPPIKNLMSDTIVLFVLYIFDLYAVRD